MALEDGRREWTHTVDSDVAWPYWRQAVRRISGRHPKLLGFPTRTLHPDHVRIPGEPPSVRCRIRIPLNRDDRAGEIELPSEAIPREATKELLPEAGQHPQAVCVCRERPIEIFLEVLPILGITDHNRPGETECDEPHHDSGPERTLYAKSHTTDLSWANHVTGDSVGAAAVTKHRLACQGVSRQASHGSQRPPALTEGLAPYPSDDAPTASELIWLAKSETRTSQGQQALITAVCQSARPREEDCASRTRPAVHRCGLKPAREGSPSAVTPCIAHHLTTRG